MKSTPKSSPDITMRPVRFLRADLFVCACVFARAIGQFFHWAILGATLCMFMYVYVIYVCSFLPRPVYGIFAQHSELFEGRSREESSKRKCLNKG